MRALTHKDVPKNIYTILCLIGVGPDEEPVLAEDEVRYQGEQIAAIIAETEEAATEAASRVDARPGRAAGCVRRGRSAQAGRTHSQRVGHQLFHLRLRARPANPCRKVRYGDVEQGLCRGGLHRRRPLPDQPHRARPHRDHRLHRQAGGGWPLHRLHQHPGALLHPGQRRPDPRHPLQQAALHRRHGRRRLWRQGRCHRRTDRHPGCDEDRPPGHVTFTPARRRCKSRPHAAPGACTTRMA